MHDIKKFRGATDITIASRFKELDQIFQDSLFIYTEREPASWLRSVKQHYAKRHPAKTLPGGARIFSLESEVIIYGRIWPKDKDFLRAYQAHEEDVLNYFAVRPACLLRLNISKGDGWPKLCDFLKLPRPRIPFPHRNRRVS